MKKLIALLLALFMLATMVACDEGTSSKKKSDDTEEETEATETVEKETNEASTGEETESKPQTEVKKPTATVVYGDQTVEFEFTDKGNGRGEMVVSISMEAPEEVMEELGLEGTLSMKSEIVTYEVEYEKEDGAYVAVGEVISVGAALEGTAAEEYLELWQEQEELDEITQKVVLDGEVLTDPDEIEEFLWEKDRVLEVLFEIKGGKLVISGFSVDYTELGSQLDCSEIFLVEDGVVRTVEYYEDDELQFEMEYDEDGQPIYNAEEEEAIYGEDDEY